MKKILFALLFSVALFSCGGGSGTGSGSGSGSSSSTLIPKKFDYKILTNEAEVKKIFDGIIAKAGDNISKLDKISIYLRRPSKEGMIRRDEPDYISVSVSYLNPNDPKKLFEYDYSTKDEKWDEGTSKGVKLMMGNAETFVLADNMSDASKITSDMYAQAVKEAWDKYKDDAKYSDQWIADISFDGETISVQVTGILSANDLEKKEYFKKKLN